MTKEELYPSGYHVPAGYVEVGFKVLKEGDLYIMAWSGPIGTATKDDSDIQVERIVIKPLPKPKKHRKKKGENHVQ